VYLLISKGLSSKLLRRTGEGLLNLKDLPTVFPPSGRATFLGFIWRLKGCEDYLLILKWLSGNQRRRLSGADTLCAASRRKGVRANGTFFG
jgi:hypothetical protein